MKYWSGVLRFALYLVILSSVLVPLSHESFAHFVKEFLIRLAFVVPFAATTFRMLRSETAEFYRLTEVSLEPICTESSPAELSGRPAPQPRLENQGSGSFPIFLVLIVAIFCLTQTSWWSHQAWIDKTLETATRWAVGFFCWGFIVLLWLPKPSTNQPECHHVVPSDGGL